MAGTAFYGSTDYTDKHPCATKILTGRWTCAVHSGLESNYKVYEYIVRHNYVLGGMIFTVCKAQLHVTCFGHKCRPSSGCTMKTYRSDIYASLGGG